MIELLKAFGRGILYVLCFPFFVVALLIFAAIGLLAFIFQIIKSVIFFFTGQKFFPELPEDRELRLRREAEEARNNPTPIQPQPAPQEYRREEVVPGNIVFEETFPEKDYKVDPTPTVVVMPVPEPAPQPAPQPVPEPVPEPKAEPAMPEENPISSLLDSNEEEIEESEIPETEADINPGFVDEDDSELEDILNPTSEESNEEEELEVYRPKESDDTFIVDDEDGDEGDSGSGVDINYDD